MLTTLSTCRHCGTTQREDYPHAPVTPERVEALRQTLGSDTGGYAWCVGCRLARQAGPDFIHDVQVVNKEAS